jgi:hypothetical protein
MGEEQTTRPLTTGRRTQNREQSTGNKAESRRGIFQPQSTKNSKKLEQKATKGTKGEEGIARSRWDARQRRSARPRSTSHASCAGVAQVGNLLYRRLAIGAMSGRQTIGGMSVQGAKACWQHPGRLRITNPRYSRLPVGATALVDSLVVPGHPPLPANACKVQGPRMHSGAAQPAVLAVKRRVRAGRGTQTIDNPGFIIGLRQSQNAYKKRWTKLGFYGIMPVLKPKDRWTNVSNGRGSKRR